MAEQAYAKLVAKNLRNIAIANEKTQADIARDLKLSKATVSSWMNGTRLPRMDKVDLLCHYFNCSRADIMEDHSGEYYAQTEAARMAQAAFDDPDLRALFDIAQNSSAENVRMVTDLLRRLKATNQNG